MIDYKLLDLCVDYFLFPDAIFYHLNKYGGFKIDITVSTTMKQPALSFDIFF